MQCCCCCKGLFRFGFETCQDHHAQSRGFVNFAPNSMSKKHVTRSLLIMKLACWTKCWLENVSMSAGNQACKNQKQYVDCWFVANIKTATTGARTCHCSHLQMTCNTTWIWCVQVRPNCTLITYVWDCGVLCLMDGLGHSGYLAGTCDVRQLLFPSVDALGNPCALDLQKENLSAHSNLRLQSCKVAL